MKTIIYTGGWAWVMEKGILARGPSLFWMSRECSGAKKYIQRLIEPRNKLGSTLHAPSLMGVDGCRAVEVQNQSGQRNNIRPLEQPIEGYTLLFPYNNSALN